MSYSDQKYYARTPVKIVDGLDLGTSTASGANELTISTNEILPVFRRTQVVGLKARVDAIPVATFTGVNVVVLNGTSTLGTIDITAGTAGQWISGSVTAANAVIASGSAATLKVVGTATASGGSVGDVDLWFELQEAFE